MESLVLSIEDQRVCVRAAKGCETMTELRREIDKLDQFIVEVLKFRLSFMERAAVLKETRNKVRDEDRIEAVVDNIKAKAVAVGLNVEFAETVYRHLIEQSIEHEYGVFDAIEKG
ncbi:chorismate mutase [Emcibacter nanhaiensis]|uniref:chorismate mutase n=1 Tax=Emcibacter nanhaiensis TaxID=1505037 RepID=A0A501PRK8_9PROT|nr:chorismate mutase [Emcibacter nanhaiensis]TPD63083.1 chorismate mutase [Emcibacter nanhaiensis]